MIVITYIYMYKTMSGPNIQGGLFVCVKLLEIHLHKAVRGQKSLHANKHLLI